MKILPPLLLLVLACTGCATSTPQTRRAERQAAYAAFPPEIRAAVDQGQVKTGMNMDAVYIAWGAPAQILAGESDRGTLTTWIYLGLTMHEHRYWAYAHGRYGRRYSAGPYLEYDYHPEHYPRAEVIFENGTVKSWRSLAPPH